MLTGTTIFAGDSITVGLPPFVQVNGAKVELAKGGRSSAQVLAAVRQAETDGSLARASNLVVLAGTNDLAAGISADGIVRNLEAIWAIGRAHGLRVVALTVPPAKGFAGFGAAELAKRQQVNAAILASSAPSRKVDLDALLGDASDREKLSAKADGGDHLHPRKDVMGAALTSELANDPPASAPADSLGVGLGVVCAFGVLGLLWFVYEG